MVARTKPAGCCAAVPVRPLRDRQLRRLAGAAKALADPNRIRILRLLAGQEGPLCACDVVGHTDLSQPTVSHHLKVLKEAGLLRRSTWASRRCTSSWLAPLRCMLLRSERRGLWVFYSVDPGGAGVLSDLAGLIDARQAGNP